MRPWLLITVGGPSALAAYFTARHAGLVDPRLLKLAISLVLALTAASMLWRERRPQAERVDPPPVASRGLALAVEVVVGAVLGAISGLVGLLLGSLLRFARVPPAIAVGTNMAIGAVTGLSAGVATFLAGKVHLLALAIVTPLTLLGAHLGARRTGRLDPATLRRWIAYVILLSAALMLGELAHGYLRPA